MENIINVNLKGVLGNKLFQVAYALKIKKLFGGNIINNDWFKNISLRDSESIKILNKKFELYFKIPKIIILKISSFFKKVYINYSEYYFIGSNIALNNSFFFREDLVKDLQMFIPVKTFKKLSFTVSKEMINDSSKYKSLEERFSSIRKYQIFNFETNNLETNNLEFISNLDLLNPDNF